MGTSVGPFDALSGLFSGVASGLEEKRALQRQKALDTAAKSEKDRDFTLRRLDAAANQTRANVAAGLYPDDTLDMRPADFAPTAATVDPWLSAIDQGPFSALVNSFQRTTQQPRVAMPNVLTGGTQLLRQGESPTDKRGRLMQEGMDRRREEQDAAALAKQTAGESQKAADAAKKAGDALESSRLTLADYANDPDMQTDPAVQLAKKSKAGDPGKWDLLLQGAERRYTAKQQEKERAALRPAETKLVPVEMSDGSVVYLPPDQAAGKKVGKAGGSGAGATKQLPAPLAARVGQFGEMLKKSADLMPMVDDMDVTLGKSAARDLADGGVHIPLLGTVPGTKGVGEALMARSPAYSQYQAALQPFILAAAHAMSGARINADQTEKIRKSIELAPGDFQNPTVRAQKQKNMIDLINSIGGSLPPGGVEDQEAQMPEAALENLGTRGYKRRGAGARSAPNGDKISAGDFAKLSPAAQAYFRSVGRAP